MTAVPANDTFGRVQQSAGRFSLPNRREQEHTAERSTMSDRRRHLLGIKPQTGAAVLRTSARERLRTDNGEQFVSPLSGQVVTPK